MKESHRAVIQKVLPARKVLPPRKAPVPDREPILVILH